MSLADHDNGALSGVLAQTVSYPFEVVRRQMQVGGLTQPGRWLRWGETVCAIWMRGGREVSSWDLVLGTSRLC